MRYSYHGLEAADHIPAANTLSLTYPDDVIQVHPDLKEEYLYIKSHYNRIGLKHTENIIWDVSVNTIKDFKPFDLSVLYFDFEFHKVRPNIDWFETASYINNKNNFIAEAKNMNLPIPITFCFLNKGDIENMDQFPYPCFLKIAVSSGGKGVFYCKDISSLEGELKDIDDDVALQIQAAADAKYTLNIQYIGCKDGLKRVGITEQKTDGYAYVGSQFPARSDPWNITDSMAQRLFDLGMRGVFAFDIVSTQEDDEECFYVLECNPRFNAASYYFGTAIKMEMKQWYAINMTTNKRSLASLDIEDLEYNSHTKSGVILVGWGGILNGKLNILIAGDLQTQERLYQELKRKLS